MASIFEDVRRVLEVDVLTDGDVDDPTELRALSLEQAPPVFGERAEAKLSGLLDEVQPAAAAAAAAIEANVIGFFKVVEDIEPRESFKSNLAEQLNVFPQPPFKS